MANGTAAQIDFSKYTETSAAPQIDFTKYSGGGGTGTSGEPPNEGFWQSLGAGLPGYDPNDSFAAIKDMGSGLYHIFTHPIDSAQLTYHGIVDPMQLTNEKAVARLKQKGIMNKLTGAVQYAESGVPFLGPMLSKAGEQFEAGNPSGGLGTTAAAALPFVAPSAMEAGGSAISATPSAIRSGWRAIGNPFGLASTGEELLTQGISPRTSLLGFKPALQRAAGDLKAYDSEFGINSVQDLHEAIPEIKQKIWSQEVEPALKRQAEKPVNMKPVADAVRAQISEEMRTFDESNATKLDTLADKLETAKNVKSANSLLKYMNGQLETYFQKFPAARRANLMNNPETAGWEAGRAELRNQFLGTLEDAGENGVRDARLRYGAFDTLQDATERRVNVTDRAKPMSLSRIVGLVGAVPTGGTSLILGEISNYLNKPDVLIRRGIRSLPGRSALPAPVSLEGKLSEMSKPTFGGEGESDMERARR